MTMIIITYVAGLLTILSPCILPVLPFIFSQSGKSFYKSGLPLLLGMSVTFSLFSALAIVGGEFIIQANQFGRNIALVLLTIFGLSLIFKNTFEKLFQPLANLGQSISGSKTSSGFLGAFLLGISTGLLWAPCAGPILGLVLTSAASQQNLSQSVVLLLAYSLGASTSLALALLLGDEFIKQAKKFLKYDEIFKKTLGVFVLLGVLAIHFNWDRTILTAFSKLETSHVENKLLTLINTKANTPELKNETDSAMMMMAAGPAHQALVEGDLPELPENLTWLNSKPLTREDLLGKVVLVDFWTYSCINCLRTLPFVKQWAEKYKNDDFIVLGVHTPEFAFEKNKDNVSKAIKDLRIQYPVVLDNQYQIWNSFKNNFWPAHYFIDRQGRIRYHHFGEGDYENSEKRIVELLTEHGVSLSKSNENVSLNLQGVHAQASERKSLSPETYLGFDRAKNYKGAVDLKKDKTVKYEASNDLLVNEWSLKGQWLVEKERSILRKAAGQIKFRFKARDLNLVLGGSHIKFKVTIDGLPPQKAHGLDIDELGNGVIHGHRLYQLIRFDNLTSESDHIFEIEFNDAGVEAYAFTFG